MALITLGEETQEVGRVGDLRCGVCNSVRPFNAAARYNYVEVAMLGASGLTRYSIMCEACRTSWGLDGKQAKAYRKEGLLPAPDVPPLRRFGLLIAFVIFVMAVSLSRFGALVTAGSILAFVLVFALPGVIKGVRGKGLKGYTKDAVSADRPVSLFESVGGLPAARGTTKRELFSKCPSCGLNNSPNDVQCERCGASLSARRAGPSATA